MIMIETQTVLHDIKAKHKTWTKYKITIGKQTDSKWAYVDQTGKAKSGIGKLEAEDSKNDSVIALF